MEKELKISAENALKAYNNTDANGRELLVHLFGFNPRARMGRDTAQGEDGYREAKEWINENDK